MATVNQKYLEDRSTGTTYKLTMASGRPVIVTDANDPETDPVVQDLDTGLYYEVYISAARMLINAVSTVQNDSIVFVDTVDSNRWKLTVQSGRIVFTSANDNFVEQSIVSTNWTELAVGSL